MKEIEVPAEVLAAIHAHARAAYPEECCGFLLSAPSPDGPAGDRRIVALAPAPNESVGERRRRFVIPPEELRAAERRAEAAGRVVSGFYHSHPDHPARPSAYDQEHAWPWYAYVIVAITASGAPGPAGGFELHADRREFEERPLRITDAAGDGGS
ncbi:MAG TPA: Mov34/MPN/PAD-1 family protein [Thermoplasmata archaeon]|nr:Mov34/MPN/PAD-1 family protein [Thermoplasmata archaeon]